jgi:transcriptional regulator with XRE-family HTH domain
MLPRDKLIQLYEGEGQSLRDIAATVGVSRQTISRLATEYGIALREALRRPIYDIDATWLYEQYVTKHRSLEDLAAECGMSVANMAQWARAHCIPVRRLSRYTPHELAADTRIPPILRAALSGVGGWERLQRFAEASRYRTLQAAAQDLGLNQFALVDQVNRIESDLGSPILVRANAGRPMQLTPVGFQVVAAVAVMAGRINEGASQSSGSCSPRSVPGPAGPRATVPTGSP